MGYSSRRLAVCTLALVVCALTFAFATPAFAATVFSGKTPAPCSVTSERRPEIRVEAHGVYCADRADLTASVAIDGVPQGAPQVTFLSGPPQADVSLVIVPTADLAVGVHTVTVYVRGTSLFGALTSWSFVVANPPVLENPTPAPGSTVTTSLPVISARVSEGATGISATAVLDGQPVMASFERDRPGGLLGLLFGSDSGVVTVQPMNRVANDRGHDVTVTVTDSRGLKSTLAWSFFSQVFPPLAAADVDCMGCHATYPVGHSTTSCQGCHDPSGPIGGAWTGTPVHGAEKVVNMSCMYCHGGGYSAVPVLHSFTEDQYHDSVPQGCSVDSGCHVNTLAAEHQRYGLTCATCHMNSDPVVAAAIAAKSVDCASCHSADPSHPYRYVDHTADVILEAGPNGMACGECHVMGLQAEHDKPSSSSAGGSCVTCHPAPRDTFATWTQGCVQDGCHAPGTATAAHGSMSAKHGLPDDAAACTNSTCHQDLPADVSAIHSATTTVTAGGVSLSGCKICHSDNVLPPSPGCLNCHADKTASHYDGLRHAAAPASETISISGTDFGAHACDECHALDLGIEHSKLGSSSAASLCAACHPDSANSVAGGWNRSCAQGGCHATGSALVTHGGIDAAHAVPASECTTAACHGSMSSVAAMHAAEGCVTCHAAGETPTARCISCHDAASPHSGQKATSVSIEASPLAGVAPLAVSLIATPVADPAIGWAWSWSFGDGDSASGATAGHTYSQPGTYTASLTVTDRYGTTATTSTAIAVREPEVLNPPTVEITASAERIRVGENVTISWSVHDSSSVTISPAIGPVLPAGSQQVTPADDTTYTITAVGPGGTTTSEVRVTVVAVDPAPAGSFAERYDEFVPTDATVDSYDAARFSLVVGRVLDTQGAPMPGVRVSAKDAAQYGSSLSDETGRYVLPLDGGNARVLCFEREGLISVQRNVTPAWNEIVTIDDVGMSAQDSHSTVIEVGATVLETQMHTGAANSDVRGSRAVSLVFPAGERAYSVGADGHYTELDHLTVRATEFATATAMPGTLPKASAFTYCVDISADEAAHVVFDKPVVAWLDDFLGVGPGVLLPSGSYDEAAGAWNAEQNGISVRLLDVNSDGAIDGVDINSDGVADDLNENGSTTDEVEGLEQGRFAPGAVAWRVEVSHFSAWDWNFSWALHRDAKPYEPLRYTTDSDGPVPGTCAVASTVDPQTGVVGEDLPVAGTSITLNYSSDRVRGASNSPSVGGASSGIAPGGGDVSRASGPSGGGASRGSNLGGDDRAIPLARSTSVYVPINAEQPPGDATGVMVSLKVAGSTLRQFVPAGSSKNITFAWDGLDALGSAASGDYNAQLSAAWVYPIHYTIVRSQGTGVVRVDNVRPIWAVSKPTAVGTPGNWVMSTLVAKNVFAELGTSKLVSIATVPKTEEIAEGWTLSAVPSIDPVSGRTLFRGDGTVARGQGRYAEIAFPAGGALGSCMDMGTDGTLWSGHLSYLAATDTRTRITRRLSTRSGSYIRAICADRDGGVYCIDDLNGTGKAQVFHMSPDGAYRLVAGNGTAGTPRFDVPAVDSPLASGLGEMAVATDGTLYLRDGSKLVMALGTNGCLRLVAGGGTVEPSSVPTLGANVRLANGPITCAPDGAIYLGSGARVHKLTPDGLISYVCGRPRRANEGLFPGEWDGQSAASAILDVRCLAIDMAGHLLVTDSSGLYGDVIWEVDERGLMRRVAGTHESSKRHRLALPGPAVDSPLWYTQKTTVDPAGNLWIASWSGEGTWVEKVTTDRPLHPREGGVGFLDPRDGLQVFASDGHWLSTSDPSTGKTLLSASRNDSGAITAIGDRFGTKIRIERDETGRAVALVAPDGARTALTIDSAGHLAKLDLPDGTGWAMGYTNNGLLADVTNPKGATAHHYYDGSGRAARVVDEDGRTFEFSGSIGSDGTFASSMKTSEGTFSTFYASEDAGGTTSRVVTARGSASSLTESADGMTKTQSGSSGTVVSTKTWDSFLGVLRPFSDVVTMPSGLKRTATLDRTWNDANSDGRAESRTDKVTVNGRASTSVTDFTAGKVTRTSPAGRTVQSFYDPATLLPTRTEVPGILPVIPTYDSRGRVTSATQGNRTVSYSYDASGNVDAVTGPDGRTVSYAHDLVGRTTSATRPDSSTAGFSYDAGGALTSLTTPGGAVNTFSSSLRGLPESWTAPQSGSWTYSYDGAKHLKTATAPSGATIENTFDANGLQVGSTFSGGSIGIFRGKCGKVFGFARASETASLTYDGSLVTREVIHGSVSDTLAWTYNSDFAPTAFTYAGATQSYAYDPDGLLTGAAPFTITRRSDNGLPTSVSAPGFSLARSFSEYGELASVETSAHSFALSRDVSGRITSRTETGAAGAHEWTYAYDVLGRLTTAMRDGALAESYAYDTQGNRVSWRAPIRGIEETQGASFDVEDRMVSSTGATYTWTQDGEMASKTTSEGVTTYSWTGLGELESVVLPSAHTVSYRYDAAGNRVARLVDGTVTERYEWAGPSRPLAVWDGSGALLVRFLYADARTPYAVDTPTGRLFLSYDQVGSLVAVTDSSGTVVRSVERDSFGTLISDTAPGVVPWLGFAGGLPDADTRLTHFGARDYDPTLGRWVSKDPIGFAGGDANLFAYCGGDPVSVADPSGLWTSGGQVGVEAGALHWGAGSLSGSAIVGVEDVLRNGGDAHLATFVTNSWRIGRDGYPSRNANMHLLGGASISFQGQVTNAASPCDLAGDSTRFGFSTEFLSFDIIRGDTYWGAEWGVGGSWPARVPEVHGFREHTEVVSLDTLGPLRDFSHGR